MYLIIYSISFTLSQIPLVQCLDIEQMKDPEIRPFNRSHVSLNFEDAFKIKDFTQITKVTVILQTDNHEDKETILTEATIDYKDNVLNVNHQHLEQGKNLIVKLNPCRESKFMYLTIYGEDSLEKSKLFRHNVNLWEEFEEGTNKWICAVDNS